MIGLTNAYDSGLLMNLKVHRQGFRGKKNLRMRPVFSPVWLLTVVNCFLCRSTDLEHFKCQYTLLSLYVMSKGLNMKTFANFSIKSNSHNVSKGTSALKNN